MANRSDREEVRNDFFSSCMRKYTSSKDRSRRERTWTFSSLENRCHGTPRRHVAHAHVCVCVCVCVCVYVCGADLPGVSRDLKGSRGNPLSCTVYWGMTGRVDKSFRAASLD